MRTSSFFNIFLWLIAALAVILVIILFANGTIQRAWENWFGGPEDGSETPIVMVPNETPTPTPTAVPSSQPTSPVTTARPSSAPTFTPYASGSLAGDDLPQTGPETTVLLGSLTVVLAGGTAIARRRSLRKAVQKNARSVEIL